MYLLIIIIILLYILYKNINIIENYTRGSGLLNLGSYVHDKIDKRNTNRELCCNTNRPAIINGCGSSSWMNDSFNFIKDKIGFDAAKNVINCCNKHDICYSSCQGYKIRKRECDNIFKECNMQACNDVYKWYNPFRYICKKSVKEMNTALNTPFAYKAFNKGQKNISMKEC